MKKVLLLAAFSFLLFGCNMNPSKEARIQKLEAEIKSSIDIPKSKWFGTLSLAIAAPDFVKKPRRS
ncbi:MAG: hypothetical protein AB8H12_15410 [Lewinella sp.]